MAAASVLLAFVAFVSLGLGLVFTPVPIWGAVFAFGAPALALLGIALGGQAMSKANKRGQPSGFALAGVIMNVIAFIPACVVAMTCGMCNACVSSGAGTQQIRWNLPQQAPHLLPLADAGGAPPPFPSDDTDDHTRRDAGSHTAPNTDPNAAPSTDPNTARAPSPKPSDLPPPPIAPGPTR